MITREGYDGLGCPFCGLQEGVNQSPFRIRQLKRDNSATEQYGQVYNRHSRLRYLSLIDDIYHLLHYHSFLRNKLFSSLLYSQHMIVNNHLDTTKVL